MWLATGGVLLVIEMLTVNLLFASLAFSALLAAVASALGFNVLIQGALFGLGAAGTVAAQSLFGESPQEKASQRAAEEAAKDAQLQRDLALEREKGRYALEQIRVQTGASEAQAAALL